MHRAYRGHVPQSPSCSYQTCTPWSAETKTIAAALKGTERPKRTPFSAFRRSTSIWFACAISRSVSSTLRSMASSAFETAWRDILKRSAIWMFTRPPRRRRQNANCLSSRDRGMRQHMEVDIINNSVYLSSSSPLSSSACRGIPVLHPNLSPPEERRCIAYTTAQNANLNRMTMRSSQYSRNHDAACQVNQSHE